MFSIQLNSSSTQFAKQCQSQKVKSRSNSSWTLNYTRHAEILARLGNRKTKDRAWEYYGREREIHSHSHLLFLSLMSVPLLFPSWANQNNWRRFCFDQAPLSLSHFAWCFLVLLPAEFSACLVLFRVYSMTNSTCARNFFFLYTTTQQISARCACDAPGGIFAALLLFEILMEY